MKKKLVLRTKRSDFCISIPKQVTPEIAYLAGIIAGDGNFYLSKAANRRYPRIRLRITSGDASQLDMLNGIFIGTFGAGGRIHKHKGKECYDLHNNHRVIWLYFRKVLGLDKKKLTVPIQVANTQLFRFFLAGFFDTDGYLSRKGVIGTMMSAKSAGFLEQMTFLAHKYHSFDFAPVRVNVLRRGDKRYQRAYTRLRMSQTRRFLEEIPLRNEKYGPARN